MNNTKIAVDVGPLKSGDSVRGIGVYTRELLKALNMEGVDVFHSDLKDYEVVHFTRFNPFSVCLPLGKPKNTRFVLTIYDLIPLIYPKHYPPGIRGWINWQINKYLIKTNVDAVITISNTSKKDVCRFTGINPNRVFVTYLAPRKIFKPVTSKTRLSEVQNKYKLSKSFALYVGDINYNKSIPTLIKACETAKIPLVICGKQAKEAENMDLTHPELRHLRGVDWSKVTRLGFVEDEDMVAIYNLASVYIQPSLYEGFGLPVLEANAAGVPVIASKTQALVEIAEDAALFSEPKSAEDFLEKITMIISNPKLGRELMDKGILNAGKYSWEDVARKTSAVYEKVRI